MGRRHMMMRQGVGRLPPSPLTNSILQPFQPKLQQWQLPQQRWQPPQRQFKPLQQRSFGGDSKLHIGCGSRRLRGWINADGVPGVGEVVLDLQGNLPREAYREIYGSHVLEHCWPQDTSGILRRLHDALVPGGTLRLSVPDIRLVVKNCIDGHAYGNERSALSAIYGGTFSRETTTPDLHRQAFWKERLERLLAEAGFVNIREWGRGQYPEIDALKDFATFPFDHATGKSLISLNLEADRPGALPKISSASVVDVSIILGTVDRVKMLRDCIEATRASLAKSSYKYEIVIAYGRENDPSLPWMRTQKDIVPILGGMEGAIEAFNRAYEKSCGRYVCQINDDVIVDGDSIPRAVGYLDAQGDSSGVVFKFDRGDGQGYRHEVFTNSLHPNQMVVRREACEAVIEEIGAFWGDASHRTDKTYGGDTAFGVVCKYLGLRLDSVEGVTCKDLLAPDQLRAQNKAAISSQHGANWRAMYTPYMTMVAGARSAQEWPDCYVPRTGRMARRSPIEAGRSLRIMILPIVIPGWPQTALRDAFERIGPMLEVPHDGHPNQAVLAAAQQYKPDLVWAQIQCNGWQKFAHDLRAAVGPQCTMVQWTGDVRTDANQQMESWIRELSPSFDILLADNCTYPKKLAQQGIRAGYLSHGFESELVWEPGAQETGGAVFVGTNYKQLDGGSRELLFAMVEQHLPGVLALYGAGWRGRAARNPVDVVVAGQIMRRAAVTISKSLFCNLERYTSNRLKYAFASGAVVAVERFADMEGLGLKPGHNCLVWSTPQELITLLQDWTRGERAVDRKTMRERARALAIERFSWDRSIEELLAIVRDYRARKGQL